MVLEETVIFTEEDDAAEFISFLRKKGCPCQKVVRGMVYREEVMAGKLSQIISWYGKEAGRYEEMEDGQEEATWFHAGQQKYQQCRERIGELLAGRVPGDILYTSRDLEGTMKSFLSRKSPEILSQLFKDTGDEDSGDIPVVPGPTGENGPSSEYPFILAHLMMSENGVVTETPDGFSMKRQVSPGDIQLEISLGSIPKIDLDNVPDLVPKIKMGLDPAYVVIADPVIHLVCEPDEVMELLEGMELDDAVLDAVLENLYGKQLIIDAIIEEIEQAGVISVSDLAIRMKEREGTGLPPTIEFFLSPLIVTAVVTELRKRDVLAGNDQKIRIAGKNKGSRK